MNAESMLMRASEMKRAKRGYVSNSLFHAGQWMELEKKDLIEIKEFTNCILVVVKEKNLNRILFFAESIQDLANIDTSFLAGQNKPAIVSIIEKSGENKADIYEVLAEKGFAEIKRLYRMKSQDLQLTELNGVSAGFLAETARMDDLEELYHILYEMFDIRISRLPDRDTIKRDIQENGIFVVRKNDRIVGMAYFQKWGANTVYLYQFAVLEEARGKDLPYILLNYAIYNFGTDCRYTLWVEADNEKAVHIYKKAGFQADGLQERVFQYNEE